MSLRRFILRRLLISLRRRLAFCWAPVAWAVSSLGFCFPPLSDRVGRKPVLLLMAVLSAAVPLAFLVPALYVYPVLLAVIVFVANTGQGIASLILVLVPTESVPRQFRATSIGLATLVGEVMGATVAPTVAGALAEQYGLGLTLWLAAAASAVVVLATLLLRETATSRHG
jgi:MFS family permease